MTAPYSCGACGHEYEWGDLCPRCEAGSEPLRLPSGARRLSDVKPERVHWLWQDRIPLGKLTVIDGDPGLGKSTATLDLAARVTTGSPMPDGTPGIDPAAVVLLSAEDGAGDTIRPRLDAAGADTTRVVLLEEVYDPADEDGDRPPPRPPALPEDIRHVAELIGELGARLVIVDPMAAYLGGQVDERRDPAVRRLMHGLKLMAEAAGAAVVLVRHLNKSGGPNAVYRGGGSIGIIGAARAGLLVAADPEDDSRRILATSKNNLAPHPPALAYKLVTDELHGCARVAWQGATTHTADALLADAVSDDDERASRTEAEAFLLELFKASSGTVAAREGQAAAREAGINVRSLDRARRKLGVQSRKEGFGDRGRWVWEAPEGLTRHEDAKGAIDPDVQEIGALVVLEGLGGEIVSGA